MTDLLVVGFYLLLTLGVGLLAARGITSSFVFKTGGRQYSAFIVFATLSASFIGGGFTLGLAEKTFLFGIIYIIALWGFSVKEILVATLIAPRMGPFKSALTVGDIMAQAFGKRTKIFTGLASVLVCGGIIGAQVSACGYIMNIFLGTPHALGAILTAGIVVIYATFGGMKSVVAADVLHFIVLVVMLPLVFIFGLIEIGGIHTFMQKLPPIYLAPQGNLGFTAMIILFLSFFLGETLIPPYIQRLLIGKSVKETTRGTLLSGLLSIPFFLIIGCIGMMALILDPSLSPNLALPYVIKAVMPIGLKGLAIAAMLAVVMSSADSFLNSTATSIVHDVLSPLGIHSENEKKELFISRLATLILGVIAIIFALSASSVLDILLYSYQFWTPFILIPLIAAIFGVRSTDKVFLISAGVGVGGVIWWNILFPKSQLEGALEGVIVGVILNSITFFICQKIFPKPLKPELMSEETI